MSSSLADWSFQWCKDWNIHRVNPVYICINIGFKVKLELFNDTHHLWCLQVSAPLTSSVVAAESLMSSMITTNGTSSPLCLSIWFARLDRYNCNSWKQRKLNKLCMNPWNSLIIANEKIQICIALPSATDDACWRWQQHCDPGDRARGRPQMSLSGCDAGGSGPDAEPGRFFLSHWAQTEPGACASAAGWCNAAS